MREIRLRGKLEDIKRRLREAHDRGHNAAEIELLQQHQDALMRGPSSETLSEQTLGEIMRECREHPEQVREEEQAFRRGHHHAVVGIIDYLEMCIGRGVPLDAIYSELVEFEDRVQAWRYDLDGPDEPPLPEGLPRGVSVTVKKRRRR